MADDIVRYEDRDGQQITLTPQDVAEFCASGGHQLTRRDVVSFMATCKALGANPFTRDVYLVKYKDGEPASIVAGKNYYTRVAAQTASFDGMTAGIVVTTQAGELAYRTGSLLLPGDALVGGWAEVRDKRWSVPVRAEVGLAEYNQHRSLWNSKPATMIRKVALVQALREAYPDRFSGVYDGSEMPDAPQPQPVAADVRPAAPQPSEADKARMAEVAGEGEAARRDVWAAYLSGGMAAVEAWASERGAVAEAEGAGDAPAGEGGAAGLYDEEQEF